VNAVLQAAFDLQEAVRARGWPFCFIGGIVVSRWGAVRQTEDADMTLLTQFERDDECINGLLHEFEPWFADSLQKAHRFRILFLKHANGIRMDVALGVMEFEERSIGRASWWDSQDGPRLFTCSAEDLIVHKAYASRDQDWADVENVISVQGHRLNVPQILRELQPLALLKEDDGIITQLKHRLRKAGLM
jgi:hypothetical protein